MKRLAAHARTAFAALALVLCVRYGFSAVRLALAVDGLPPGATAPSAAPSAAEAQPSATTNAPAVGGAPIRVKLMIGAGPDRSLVYVDQANVGKSPYLGETSCRTGEEVVIEIVPPEGEKLTFRRRCEPGTIRVE